MILSSLLRRRLTRLRDDLNHELVAQTIENAGLHHEGMRKISDTKTQPIANRCLTEFLKFLEEQYRNDTLGMQALQKLKAIRWYVKVCQTNSPLIPRHKLTSTRRKSLSIWLSNLSSVIGPRNPRQPTFDL
jgi:hypothetical protein